MSLKIIVYHIIVLFIPQVFLQFARIKIGPPKQNIVKLNQPVDRKIISIGKVSSGVTIAGLALTNKIIESAIQTEKPIEEAVILVSLPQDAEVDNKLDEEQEISSITKSPILRQETVTNATRTTPCVIFELLEGVAEVGKGVLTFVGLSLEDEEE